MRRMTPKRGRPIVPRRWWRAGLGTLLSAAVVVTVIGGQLGTILGGSIIIESLFGLPGLGLLTIESIRSRDLPQVQGCLMVLALIVVLVNLVTDLYYAWLDPRIRYS